MSSNTSGAPRSGRWLLPLLPAALLGAATPASGHPIPFSYLDLNLEAAGIEGRLTMHALDLAHDLGVDAAALDDRGYVERRGAAILELVRGRLLVSADGAAAPPELVRIEPLPANQAVALSLRFAVARPPGVVGISGLLFPYDPQHQTFVNVYEQGRLVAQEILSPARPGFDHYPGGGRGTLAAFRKYLGAGVRHIFLGGDHVLFVIGLLLAGGTVVALLRIVTAFTVAHSVTLTLAALDLLHPSPRVVEPAIALSIVFVGMDNLLAGKEGRDVRVWVAAAFGLIHGFGFAGVLRETGLPRPHLAGSVFAFNLGVEIGQACIVLAVAPAILYAARRSAVVSSRIARAGSVLVAAAGAYWFVERVFLTP